MLGKLRDDMAQAMRIPLPSDMIGDAARILDVLLPVQYLPDRVGLRPRGIPHVDRKDQRIAPRMVIEDGLGRRVGEDPAIPVEIAVNANGRESRWQRSGSHDVLYPDLGRATVEIAHHTGAHMGGA